MPFRKKTLSLLFCILEWTGAFCIILSYLLLVLELTSAQSLLYLFLNICGAVLLASVLVRKSVWGGAFVQVFWIGVSVLGIVRLFL